MKWTGGELLIPTYKLSPKMCGKEGLPLFQRNLPYEFLQRAQRYWKA